MLNTLKILLAEDISSDAELVLRELRKSGFSFVHVVTDNRKEYIARIHEFNPDLILSDYSMPDFDGMQALLIRQQLAPNIPFILVTGSINRETAVDLMKSGADDYVIKEHISRLPSAIRSAMEKAEIRKARKKAEDELKVLSRAIEQNPASIVITDTEGYIRYVNPKFTELTGYSAIEVIGKNPRMLKTGNTSEEEYHKLWKSIRAGGEWKGEFQNRKKNGELYYESAVISPITNEEGKINYFLALKEDITEKKKMLADLIAAKDKAEAAEKELLLAKEKAEESDRLKTAFLHNISHEIRTPMNAIIGFSEFLNSPDLTHEKRKTFTKVIIQSSNQLLSIITDIINISTIESGQEKVITKTININKICREIYDQFSDMALNANIKLSYHTALPDENALLKADESKLIQILGNLVGNALKFTPEGFIRFGYRTCENEIEFFTEDSGIGIAQEMHEEIFKRFRQVEFAATRHFGGSGLGLSISKAYVEMMGGTIRVTSALGMGSVFYFTIPYNAERGLKSVPAMKPASAIKPGGKTIVIAEDDDSNFLLMKEMITGLPLEIYHAINGKKALEICTERIPDLVFMDIKMPVMDGFQATREIKKIRPELPIIALTAYTMAEEREQALQSGFDGYITKPVKKNEIFRVLNQYFKPGLQE